MQTFLPHRDFAQSARDLDTKRLGKQRVEVIQILKALTLPEYAWKSHPAVLMWEGCEEALVRYGLAMAEEWCRRGFADTCGPQFGELAGLEQVRSQEELERAGLVPSWLGEEEFHRAHQSNLIRKDPEHYRPLYPGVPDDLEYIWPRRSAKVLERERRALERAAQKARASREVGSIAGAES